MNCLWKFVDWTQQDCIISKQIGFTRERVRQIRNELGKPQSPNHGKLTKKPYATKARNVAIFANNRLTASQIAKIAKVSYKYTTKIISKNKLPHLVNRPAINKLINWNLSDRDINRIWEAGINYAGSCRYKNGYNRPRWDARKNWNQNKEYLIAIREEEKRAEGFLNASNSHG